MERIDRTLAKRTVPEKGAMEGGAEKGFAWLRESQRGKMARTLEYLLKVARKEARGRNTPNPDRLKWVNTICYITQTYNSLLKDAEIDQLKAGMIALQEMVKKLNQSRHQQSQTNTRTS